MIEIERKFLIQQMPDYLKEQTGQAIRQGYITNADDLSEVRIRQKGDACYLTIKRGGGLIREEVEIQLSAGQFETLWPLTAGRRVEKVRYALPWQNVTIECDVFQGRHAGLIMAEVEFESETDSQNFTPLDWFGKEVTTDKQYKNRTLAS